MTGDVIFERVAPVIPVSDLNVALDRYGRLGFSVRSYDGDAPYGYADRGDVSLHLSEQADHDPKRIVSVVYLFVSDADALFAEWSTAGVDGRFEGPFDTPYGLREFAFVDPDGTAHRVGSPLSRLTGR